MDELVVKHLRGEATEFEERRLEQWRAGSPKNERQFKEIRSVWECLDQMEWPAVSPPRPVTEMIEGTGTAGLPAPTQARRRTGLASRWRQLGLAAAAVMAAVFITVVGDEEPGPTRSSLSVARSDSGLEGTETLVLTDGSFVRLALDTEVQFHPSPDQRRVSLEGRAFFAIAPDEGDLGQPVSGEMLPASGSFYKLDVFNDHFGF